MKTIVQLIRLSSAPWIMGTALILANATCVRAQYYSYPFNYQFSNGQITISGCNAAIHTVIIPSTLPVNGTNFPVTALGQNSFSGLINLNSVVIPDSVYNIGFNAFGRCSYLTDVVIGGNVTNIDLDAFLGCTILPQIQIPDSVVNIGQQAFNLCQNLTNITFGAGITNTSLFYDTYCPRLLEISVNTSNPVYADIGGVLCDASRGTIIQYPFGRRGSYTVPNSITNIESSAFSGCAYLTNVFFSGDAPSGGDQPIFATASGYVYYLPGTSGWGLTYGGLPTAPWFQPNPSILSRASSLMINSSGFNFTISWATNTTITVEALTNLTGGWSPLQAGSLTNGTFYFSDPQWTNYPNRFYRIRSP